MLFLWHLHESCDLILDIQPSVSEKVHFSHDAPVHSSIDVWGTCLGNESKVIVHRCEARVALMHAQVSERLRDEVSLMQVETLLSVGELNTNVFPNLP